MKRTTLSLLLGSLMMLGGASAHAGPVQVYFEGVITNFATNYAKDESQFGKTFTGSFTFDASYGKRYYQALLAWPNNTWWHWVEQSSGCTGGYVAGVCKGYSVNGKTPGPVLDYQLSVNGESYGFMGLSLDAAIRWSSMGMAGNIAPLTGGAAYVNAKESVSAYSGDTTRPYTLSVVASSMGMSVGSGEAGWLGVPGDFSTFPELPQITDYATFFITQQQAVWDCNPAVGCTYLSDTRTDVGGTLTWMSTTPRASEVPEPAGLALFGTGLAALVCGRRKRLN